MKKFTKMLSVLLGGVLMCATVAFFTGCNAEGDVHTHTLSRISAVAPGCTTDGNTNYFKCDDCGKYFADGNGETEIAEQATIVPAAHTLVWHDADGEHLAVSNGKNYYYQCSVCSLLFGDLAATETVTLSKKPVPMFTDRTCTSDLTFNGEKVFDSTVSGGVHEPIAAENFVLRFFMGFNHDVNVLKNYEPVEVHANIHRQDATPDYWQFVLYYRPSERLVQLHYGGTNKYLTQEQTDIFKARNGFYFLFVREGETVHLYIEDLDGTPIKIADINNFTTGAVTLIRIAHFEGYFADEKHAGVIKEMDIAMNTTDLDAERSNPTVVPPEDQEE